MDKSLSLVGTNPLAHLVQGSKNFLSTNWQPALALAFIQALVSLAFALISTGLFDVSYLQNSPHTTDPAYATSLISKVWLFTIPISLISGYLVLVQARIILKGVVRQKITLGEALSLTARRSILALLVYLALIATFAVAFIAAIIISVLLAIVSPALAIVFSIAIMIVAFVYVIRYIYVFMIVIDDHRPNGVSDVYKRSTAIWRKSSLAIAVYVLASILALVLFATLLLTTGLIVFHGSNIAAGHGYNFAQPGGLNIIGSIINSLIANFITALFIAGFVDIYLQAKAAAA